jgi:hypothetical protein
MRGRICYGPRALISIDCAIRNLGPTGAMLGVPTSQVLPGAFFLIHILEGVAYDAKLVWRLAERAGVAFSAKHDLRTPKEGDLSAVRTIWLALAPS